MADGDYRTDLSFSTIKKALTRTTLNLADNFNTIFEQLISNDARLKENIDAMKINGVKANGGNADFLEGKGISYFSKDGHKHKKADIEDLPASLPANGGNADTVAGKSPGNEAGKMLVLDGQGKVPKENLPVRDTDYNGYWIASKTVSVGDVKFAKNGPSWAYFVCTQAGTTGSSEPEILTADSTIVDGSAKWIVRNLGNTGLAAHPVGSIYMSTVATSPAILFGGTWEEMPAGRVLLAQGTSAWGTDYAAGSTGGEATHTLTVGELPTHGHTAAASALNIYGNLYNLSSAATVSPNADGVFSISYRGNDAYAGGGGRGTLAGFLMNYSNTPSISISSTGSSISHNNMQPYLAIFLWKRIA